MVVLEQASQSLTAGDGTDLSADFRSRLQDLVIKALMGTLSVIMAQEFGCGVPKRRLTEEDDLRQRLLLERSEKAFQSERCNSGFSGGGARGSRWPPTGSPGL